jgi:hypothetical protein
MLLTLSASLGATLFLSACGSGGGSNAGGSGGRDADGSGRAGSGSTEDVAFDADTLVGAAEETAALSDEELSAALAAADLDGEMALAGPSGLITELGNETTTRVTWAVVGMQMKTEADLLPSWVLSGMLQTQSAPNLKAPGVRVQAGGGGDVSEAFGAGWLGGSLFNTAFVEAAINAYGNGKTGIQTDSSPTGDVKATAGLSDTSVTLDANAEFSLGGLTAIIDTHSAIPCPDANGLMTVESSLDVTGKAGQAFQRAQFRFELTVEVDDDAQLTGRNQLKSGTKTHTEDSTNGYKASTGSVDVSITEFADGHFGDPEGSYQGMSDKDAAGWMHMGMLSGILYRQQLLPQLQKMLDAGRCVSITVEPSKGPMNLDPLANVDLLTKPRAKLSNTSRTTGGTVQAKFKSNAGGAIVEGSDKVPADATFHYVAPLDFNQSETITFQSRSKRGTGKLDYTLTTSPHAD